MLLNFGNFAKKTFEKVHFKGKENLNFAWKHKEITKTRSTKLSSHFQLLWIEQGLWEKTDLLDLYHNTSPVQDIEGKLLK